MVDKLVSVCINAYNAEKYILKTINSVINQSYKKLQIIVIDDCSTDDTYNIVKSIKDDRIELYKTQTNGHMSYACNEAFKYVKGDYVAHLDADDLWVSNKIEKQVEFLEEHQEYGACFTHSEIIDEEDNLADESFDDIRDMYALDNRPHHELYRFFFDNSNKLSHCSALIRSDVVKKVGQYDVSILFLQDFDFWMRLITLCNIYIMPERLILYRCGGNSSDMTQEKWTAYNNEFVRIIYKSINLCPDDLFLKAFADKLKLTGEHTHDEVEIEKALLLLEGPITYRGNPVLGIYKFSELFKQEKFVVLAKEKFNFTTRDLYKAQYTPFYFDIGNNNHLVNSLAKVTDELENERKISLYTKNDLADCKEYIGNLEALKDSNDTQIAKLENYVKSLEENVKNLEDSNNSLNEQLLTISMCYEKITKSFWWKLAWPIRKISSTAKQIFAKK